MFLFDSRCDVIIPNIIFSTPQPLVLFFISVLLLALMLQRCTINFRVQRAPDKLPSSREMIRGEQQRGQQVEEKRAELTNIEDNREAKCLRK